MSEILVNGEPIDYSSVPVSYMAGGLQRWFEHGIDGGSFLMALLSNDLRCTCECADDMNSRYIFEWVKWLYNNAPRGSWGSPENVKNWRISARKDTL